MPRNSLLSSLAVILLTYPGATAAQEPIRFARTPDISPDGKLIAFSYQGDVWVVESIGGTARAVTSHPAHDFHPLFSPDGRQLAFASDRHGGYDVYTVSVRGGRPRRITFHESTDTPTDWSPDGKSLLFASTRDPSYPIDWELFSVPAAGGRNHKISPAGGKSGVYSPAGDRIAYVRGPGAWYRKGYRGSSNDEVWVSKADGTDNRRLTAFEGEDDSPMWSPDGKTIYFVSDRHGSAANLVSLPASALDTPPADKGEPPAGAPTPTPLTSHTEGVREARISRDGNWIVYECGADLWLLSTTSPSAPRKLAIQAFADYKTNPEKVQTFTSGATEYALSADEKHLAFAVHGKVFLMEISSKGKVKQLTHGPHNDHGIAWAPDASRILFLSDRSGHEDIYVLEADDPAHPKFLEAHRFKVRALTSTPEAEAGLSFSPDGKLVAFIRAGKLVTMKPDGTELKEVVAERNVVDYDWSPDGKWLVYARQDPSFASELYIVPATGPTADEPIRNVTRYATLNVDVTWSADGSKLAFLSDRRGSGNLYTIDLRKPAVEGHKEKSPAGGRVAIDWEDVHLRAESVCTMTATTAAISPDGSEVAFRDEKTNDLWLASTSGSKITRLTTGGARPGLIRWSKRKGLSGYLNLLYYLDGKGNINLCKPPSGSGSATVAKVPFKIDLRIRTQETYQEMFDQGWRFLAENFYDAKFHGADWDAVREKYRPLVKHVTMKEDLHALMYLMMGELNASHLGISGSSDSPEESTAELGLLYDDTYPGPGLKVREVIKRGPADLRGLDIRAGDVIVSIDDVDLKPDTDVCRLLAGKVNEMVQLEVTADPKAGKRRHLEIKAVSRSKIASLMYDRWVENNAERVAKLSKGKLGYIHIPSMDEEGLDTFVRRLYSDCFDKEAIVIDVRYNGGGFTHDRVLNYLGGKEHTFFRQRDGGQGLVLRASDRKWTRPMVVLINNRSYSDAEIFPSAFRTLGLGKLVGEPTGGMVIGTTAVRLVDGSLFRIPRTGVFTPKGVNMEREGVRPDVPVAPHPDEVARGEDVQLDTAVGVLEKEVVAWKKSRAEGVAAKPEEEKAGGGAPMAPGGSR